MEGKRGRMVAIYYICVWQRGVNISDDDVPVHATKPISAKRIAEYEFASTKKKSHASPSAQPSQPQRRSQAETLQFIIERQNGLADRQEVIHQNIETLKNGQVTLITLFMDLSTRIRNEDSSVNSDNLNYGDLLGRLNDLTAFPTENSHGAQENDDDDRADA
ncbi:hypothetical protein SESBI_00942 [Sesbania bispinosa]|nr:hypothetical protein SESBI_00942 [Sesbania bispinosa]